MLAGVLLTAFTVFMNCPYYQRVLFHSGNEGANWPAFFEQVREPFTDHTHKHAAHLHATKLGFRFVPAVMCKMLGVDNTRRALVFQLVAQYVLCTLVFVALRRGARSPVQALATAVPFCLVAGGHPFWQDEWGFFDTVAIAFLLAAGHVRSSVALVLLLLLAFFTDERAVIASPALLLAPHAAGGAGPVASRLPSGRLPSYAAALVLYGILRLGLGHSLGLRTEPVGPEFFLRQLHLLPYALLHGHEGFLLVAMLAVVIQARRGRNTDVFITVAGTLAVWSSAVWVFDLERSMGYLLPHLIASTITVRSAVSSRHFAVLIASVTALNLLHSDSLTLPEQLVEHFTGDTPGHMVRTWLGWP